MAYKTKRLKKLEEMGYFQRTKNSSLAFNKYNQFKFVSTKGAIVGIEKPKTFVLEKSGYEDGEWSNQFYTYHFKDEDGKEVILSVDVSTNEYPRYNVTYDGAVDFSGNNKKDLLKAYPEFKKVLK